MLEDQGVYHHVCDNNDTTSNHNVCPRQTSALLQISLVTQLTQLVSPLLGYIIDKYSLRTLAICMTILSLMGIGLVVVTLAWGDDRHGWLLYVAFSLIAIHSWMGGMLILPVTFYFTERTRVRVTTLLNALFDAGGMTYLGLWAIYSRSKRINVTLLMIGYLGLAVVLYSVGLYYWFVAVPVQDSKLQQEEESGGDGRKQSNEKIGCNQETEVAPAREDPYLEKYGPKEQIVASFENDRNHSGDDTCKASSPVNEEQTSSTTTTTDATSSYVPVAKRSQKDQIISAPFFMLTVFFSIHIVSNLWYVSTVRDFLAELGDNDYGNRYLA